jgi:hypothetical protein
MECPSITFTLAMAEKKLMPLLFEKNGTLQKFSISIKLDK